MKSFFPTRLLLALVIMVAAGGTVLAQEPADGGPAPANPAGPTDIPLDGGVSLLLAGGITYGLKQLRDRRKRAQ